jgi:hypothetical protein
VPTPDRSFTVEHRRRQLPGWVAAAAAALVVIVTIGGATWLLRGAASEVADEPVTTITVTPDVTVATEMPPPTTVAPTVTSEAPAVPVAPSLWTRIDVGDLVGGSIATGPMGMVALVTNTPLEGTAWFSQDGEDWQPLAVPPGKDVAYGDPGFVICCHQTGPIAATASSFSPDGVTWFTTPFDAPDFTQPPESGTHESMTAVTYGNGKFVAVGEIIEIDDQLEWVSSFGVWRSDDGQTWTAVPQDLMFPTSVALGVTFVADRFVVATGAGVWHSPDGATWSQVSQMPDVGAPDAAYGDGGYVAVGYADVTPDDYRAVIWHSTDGVSWEIVVVNPDWGDIADVVYGDQGYLAVGWSGGSAAVWHSTDGVSWTGPVHDPDVFTDTWFHAAGYIDGRYVIFGETDSADPAHGWVFISE